MEAGKPQTLEERGQIVRPKKGKFEPNRISTRSKRPAICSVGPGVPNRGPSGPLGARDIEGGHGRLRGATTQYVNLNLEIARNFPN